MKTIFYFEDWFHAVKATDRKEKSKNTITDLRRCPLQLPEKYACHTPHIILRHPRHAHRDDLPYPCHFKKNCRR